MAKAGLSNIRLGARHTSARAEAAPHHQVAMLGIFNRAPTRSGASLGRKAINARVSNMPDPNALTMVSPPALRAETIPGVPRREAGLSSSGSA